ncbi:MAG: hypothetical protein UX45_C0034G0008 [Candidatus Uhrbacteria bacterium GW2011_GWF2_46_218]|uniref:Uncharacterized protein n=1 Tax=Candidatus Uhrbacteria bacterium GW2011_GWF2_46_218 TaxID=1619001 RepID=A0A0G1SC25_9BACT|nr:MAG: hypothetical protein UX45_C0034G0008 [Candidatus Uhrbacteria bacterium GW2011_GWF2_46_218]
MTPQEELANYLATGMKDYPAGVRIFKNLGVDQDANNFLSTPNPGKIHVNMLRNKLQHYARVYEIKAKITTAPPRPSPRGEGVRNAVSKVVGTEKTTGGSGRVTIDANPVVRFEELPAVFQDKYKQAGELSNQNKTLHAELKQLIDEPTKKERRGELSAQIIDNKKTVRQFWDDIDRWWAENKDKAMEQRIADKAGRDAVDKLKRIKANKTYIRRTYGTGKKADELAARMKELEGWGIDYTEDIAKSDFNTA